MKVLYSPLVDRINDNKSLFSEKGLSEPQTIDLYAGQPDAPHLFEFFTPAIFINYAIEWDNGSRDTKAGVVRFDLHVLLDPSPSVANFSERRPEALQKLEFYEVLTNLIDGYSGENFGSIVLTGEEPAQTEFFMYHIFHFETRIFRRIRQPLKKVSANPNIQVNE